MARKNKEDDVKYQRKWYQENKARIKKERAEYQKEYMPKWRKENREKYNEYMREYQKARRLKKELEKQKEE